MSIISKKLVSLMTGACFFVVALITLNPQAAAANVQAKIPYVFFGLDSSVNYALVVCTFNDGSINLNQATNDYSPTFYDTYKNYNVKVITLNTPSSGFKFASGNINFSSNMSPSSLKLSKNYSCNVKFYKKINSNFAGNEFYPPDQNDEIVYSKNPTGAELQAYKKLVISTDLSLPPSSPGDSLSFTTEMLEVYGLNPDILTQPSPLKEGKIKSPYETLPVAPIGGKIKSPQDTGPSADDLRKAIKRLNKAKEGRATKGVVAPSGGETLKLPQAPKVAPKTSQTPEDVAPQDQPAPPQTPSRAAPSAPTPSR